MACEKQIPDNMYHENKQKGVKSVEYSYITSKILITYDDKLTDEKKIIDWINLVWKTVVDNRGIYENMSAEEVEKNLDKFYSLLREKLKGNLS